MGLLNQETPGQLDDAARGESFTKGSSHLVWASVAAAVVVTIAIAIYVIVGEKPPVATGQILEVWAHPMHEVTPAFDAAGAAVSQSTFDQVLVFTRVQLHNQSKGPALPAPDHDQRDPCRRHRRHQFCHHRLAV